MKKFFNNVIFIAIIILISATLSWGHFLVVKPSADNVVKRGDIVLVETLFTHPMEGGPHMEFKIKESGMVFEGEKTTLNWKTELISSYKGSSKKVPKYFAKINLDKPGVYKIFVDMEPYFEPAEQKFIRQIAKVIISALGKEEGWDEPIGLKVEILPMVKPFALWEGNIFKGRVLVEGKPAANVEVEVEYLNTKGVKVPFDSFVTQTIKTDENGYFEYSIPWEGWWGFSAIIEGGKIKGSDGKEYPLELDAVIWVKAYPKPRAIKEVK